MLHGTGSPARASYRGPVNRLLVGLTFDGSVVAPGTELIDPADATQAIGVVTSSAMLPDRGPIGLGYLRRDHAATRTVVATHDGRRVKIDATPGSAR